MTDNESAGKERQDLLHTISTLKLRVNELEGDNDQLRRRNGSPSHGLPPRSRCATPHTSFPDPAQPDDPQGESLPAPVPYRDYADLVKKYNTLANQLAEYKIAFDRLTAKFRQEKQKYEKLEKLQSSRSMNADASAAKKKPRSFVAESPEYADPEDSLISPPRTVEGSALGLKLQSSNITKNMSSQTTEDAPEETEQRALLLRDQDDDDIPVVVKERSLKRNKRRISTPNSIEIFEDGQSTEDRWLRIKHEPLSSPPLVMMLPPALSRNETLDLDEVGDKPVSQHKRRRIEGAPHQSQGDTPRFDMSYYKRTSRLPEPQDDHSTNRVEEMDVSNSTEIQDFAPVILGGGLENVTEPEAACEPANIASQEDERLEEVKVEEPGPAEQSTRPSRPLRPLSANARLQPQLPGFNNDRKRRSRRDSDARILPLLAEDGDQKFISRSRTSSRRSSGPDGHAKASMTKEKASRRLTSLLQTPAPAREQLPLTTASRSTKNKPTGKESAAKADISSYFVAPTENTIKGPIKEGSSESGPLRSRPVHSLKVDDFKVNPKFNYGLDYAFTETVRNRDARRCLPGCSRPECCGTTFRKLVEIGGAPELHRRSLWSDSQETVDEEERLLEEHLGDDRGRLKSISADERRSLLTEARTRLVADKYGRHRQAFERRPTPPGFWRTDMPSTQEAERDREEAKKLERQKVEERYKDAKRGGGRWLFRDE